MSVKVVDRKESYLEYVQNARKLANYTFQKVKKFPKGFTFSLSNRFITTADDILQNAIYIQVLNRTDYPRRLMLERKTIALLQFMQVKLFEVSECINRSTLSWSQLNTWNFYIDKEISLLRGLITSDREKMKAETIKPMVVDIMGTVSDEVNINEVLMNEIVTNLDPTDFDENNTTEQICENVSEYIKVKAKEYKDKQKEVKQRNIEYQKAKHLQEQQTAQETNNQQDIAVTEEVITEISTSNIITAETASDNVF